MILVTIYVNEQQKKRMKEVAQSEVIFADRNKLSTEQLAEADIIIGNIPLVRLAECRKLKWLQLNNAGADDFAKSTDLREDTVLTNATGAYGLVIAEHMLGMLFVLQKHLISYYIHQQNRRWQSEAAPMILEGKTVVVVGTGDIGTTFAKKLKGLGCYTIGIKRRKVEVLPYFDEIYTNEQADEVLPRADILALALPQTSDTICFLNRERLKNMKSSAILLNVGRGSAVDTDALVDALQEKRIAGAALDVTEPEPLPPEHPLWQCENMILTPHVAGNYDVPETLEKIVEIAVDNLDRYQRQEPLHNVVDRETGYCR